MKADMFYDDGREISDLKQMLKSSESLFSERTAFMVKDHMGGPYRNITYKQFKSDVDAFGTALLDLGLQGKKIGVISENRYEWAVTYLAVVNGVGIIVPIDKELQEEEFEYIVRESEADCIVYSGKYEELFKKNKTIGSQIDFFINMDTENQLSFQVLLKRGYQLLSDGNRDYLDMKIDREKMSILLFTSGTTGLAKGVMLSHKNIVTNLMAMVKNVHIVPEDVFLSVLPIHHTYECTCGFLLVLYRGASTAFCEGLKYITKNLEEANPTVFLAVPLIFENIYKKIWSQARKSGSSKKLEKVIEINNITKKVGLDISKKLLKKVRLVFGGKMRLLISGGAAIDPEVLKGLKAFGFNALQGYGLTECSPIVAANPDWKPKDNSAGLALPGVEVRINDPNEEGVGEIVTRSDSVMLGYYKNKEATDAVLKDGWFYTGDLGYLDKEGYVYITGRKKNVIITKNGKNIFPEELEFYLSRSLFVEESLVWGKDSEESGETLVYAQIKPNQEEVKTALGEDYSEDQIKELLQAEVDKINKNLPFYKKIRRISIRKEEFAKTTTKKIKRYIELNTKN